MRIVPRAKKGGVEGEELSPKLELLEHRKIWSADAVHCSAFQRLYFSPEANGSKSESF
jgi:hypothetical protein